MAINKNDFKNAEGNYEAKNTLMDAVIDGVNGNEANLSLIDFSSSLTPISGVTDLRAYKTGRVHFLSFTYKPTQTGFTTAITGIPSAYLPGVFFAGSVGTTSSSEDANRGITAAITAGGNVYVVTTTLPSSPMRFTFTWIA